MPNRLITETSPYLLQHSHNPVDWHPWGEEALQKDRDEDKPIFLSIGYSACHWCHVMERESFEEVNIANLMNQHFVNIKVDREERPDLDSIYMLAVQTMRGQGGWPLSIFLTPQGKPFYGGTYFPPEDRHGIPGFPRVLMAVVQEYKNRRAEVAKSAQRVIAALESTLQSSQSTDPLTSDIFSSSYGSIRQGFDPENGGFGTAPKFPQPMILEFLLRHHHRSKDPEALYMVETTLKHMAQGGIYDHLGGGFHRYSTDPFWLVPHFEKMLYDNALLSRLYLHAYQYTGNSSYRDVAQETMDYVLREMTDPHGGFYSSQDADSEGIEGKFFLWTRHEIEQVVGQEYAQALQSYFGITDQGNFEGSNILHRTKDISEVATEYNINTANLEGALDLFSKRLLEVRNRRVPPETDTKVLTSWNGFMLHSLALGAAVLGRQDYLLAAVANADFLLENLRDGNRLLRTYKDGQAHLNGYLEDYASLADGLIALYEVTFDPKWLKHSQNLADQMLELFWDQTEGVFYDTGMDHESLVVRPRDVMDNAIPCGNSIAADVLLRLSVLSGKGHYAIKAAAALRSVQELITRVPSGFGHWLGALDFYLSSPNEIAVVGPKDTEVTQQLLGAIFKRYLPNRVIAGYNPEFPDSYTDIPLLEDKNMLGNSTTVYVCQNYICQMPVTTLKKLEKQLAPAGLRGLTTLT